MKVCNNTASTYMPNTKIVHAFGNYKQKLQNQMLMSFLFVLMGLTKPSLPCHDILILGLTQQCFLDRTLQFLILVFTLFPLLLSCHHVPGSSLLALRAKHERPRVKVHGAWAFGRFLNIFVMDEVAKHDSSCIIEMLAITLENVSWYLVSSNEYLRFSLILKGMHVNGFKSE